MRILGLDVGSKTIGVAVSDELGWTAQGLNTLRWDELDLDLGVELITQIATDYKAEKLIIGWPKNMDGSLGERAIKVKQLADRLQTDLNIPVVLWDERLSTKAAEKILLAGDVSRRKRKKVIDKMAACLILQGFLDSVN